MKRILENDDGTETTFKLMEYDKQGPIHAEVQVKSLDELRDLKRAGKLIRVRMIGHPKGRAPQRSLVPWEEIEDFDWES